MNEFYEDVEFSQEPDNSRFAKWFQDNVKETAITYDSGIKLHTWIGLPPGTEVEFGTTNLFHFVYTHEGIRSIVSLFDGTGMGAYLRSVIKNEDRISILYVPENLLTTDYFERENGSPAAIQRPSQF